eukprot:4628078-Pleurochrysis_carterae.AAC.1
MGDTQWTFSRTQLSRPRRLSVSQCHKLSMSSKTQPTLLSLCPRKPEVDACCVLVAPSTCATNFPERHGQPSLVCSPLHGSESNERESICALICRFDTV